MIEELPEGWAFATLGEIGMGRSEPIDPSSEPDIHFELWSVPAFVTGEPELKYGREIESGKQRVRPGDVLLCKINPRINRVWLVGPHRNRPQIASTEWIVIRCGDIDNRFLVQQLREGSFRERMLENVSGVGGSLMRARPEGVRELEVVVAPLAEQRRIVAKIEELTARSRAVRAELAEVPTLLEQFRQSVLASAFRGDLTADWRAKHPHTEPASELLARIRTERRKQWEAKYPKKKYVEPEPVDESDLPELPEGWCWASFDELFDYKGGSQPPKETFSNEAILGYVRLLQIRDFESDRYAVYIKDDDKWPKCDSNDIMIGRYGASIGRVLTGKAGAYNVALVKMIFDPDFCHGAWVGFYLRSEWFQRPLMLLSRSAQNGFNKEDTATFKVPVPPLEEQVELARRAVEHWSTCDRLMNNFELANVDLDQLDQSILAKAFRGELVPQDPADEPASVLLERLRAGQAETSSAPKKRRGKSK